MERLIGHLVSIMMLRRDLLACLGNVYVFIQKSAGRRQPLWPSVWKEFEWCRSLLPLAVAHCDLDWSPTVSAIDACLSGFGMTDAVASAADCGAVGTLRERSRFRGPLAA